MIRRTWPLVLAVLFVGLLVWYLFYTERIVDALRSDAALLTRIYGEVQEGITDPTAEGADRALFRLQGILIESGLPLILSGPGDTILAAENLPFEADLDSARGQERVREYIAALGTRNPPVGDPEGTHLHFGDPPEVQRLRWIPWLQAGGLLLTVLAGFTVVQSQRRAEAERAWTAMARELAHQLGTPISSLQGWVEVLHLPPGERPGDLPSEEVAEAIEEDVVRLERISRRFELIGREPELEPVDLSEVTRELEEYLRTRLPRTGPGVRLRIRMSEDLPRVRGSPVLLAWALENLVKNSVDALAGRGGKILVYSERDRPGWISLRIRDSGPGVPPEIRERIFDAGVTTKPGGWGVGLTLARRIVEGVHGGRMELVESPERGGATFELKLPAAEG